MVLHGSCNRCGHTVWQGIALQAEAGRGGGLRGGGVGGREANRQVENPPFSACRVCLGFRVIQG